MRGRTLSDRWGSRDIWLTALAVRVQLISLFRDDLGGLDLGRPHWLQDLLSSAYRIASQEAKRNDASGGTALARAAELLAGEIDRLIDGTDDEAEQEQLRALRERLAEPRARDLMADLFRGLAMQAKEEYGRAQSLRQEQVSFFREARIATMSVAWADQHPLAWDPEPLRESPDPYYVNAATRILTADAAEVELQINLEGFDARSLLSVPTLIAHELVSHVHGDDLETFSIWADGFMDWVARYYLYVEWHIDGELPRGLCLEHGRGVSECRMNASRRRAHRHAANLVSWMSSEYSMPIRSAYLFVAQLGLQLNATPEPVYRKDEFAEELGGLEHDKHLQQRIRSWDRGHGRASDLLR